MMPKLLILAPRKALILVALLFAVPFSLPATAEEHCGADREPMILDAPFRLVFESWIEQTNGRFYYGRCVGTLNGQHARIEWPEGQLKGTAKPGFPVLFLVDFLSEMTVERMGKLRYGVNRPPEHSKTVSLVAHAAEFSDIDELAAQVTGIKQALMAGSTIDPVFLELVSKAQFAYELPNQVSGTFSAGFTSILTPKTIYGYRLDYELTVDGELEEPLRIRPAGDYLRQVLRETRDSDSLPLEVGKGSLIIEPPEESWSELFEAHTMQRAEIFELISGETVLASFPASLHLPSGALPFVEIPQTE